MHPDRHWIMDFSSLLYWVCFLNISLRLLYLQRFLVEYQWSDVGLSSSCLNVCSWRFLLSSCGSSSCRGTAWELRTQCAQYAISGFDNVRWALIIGILEDIVDFTGSGQTCRWYIYKLWIEVLSASWKQIVGSDGKTHVITWSCSFVHGSAKHHHSLLV